MKNKQKLGSTYVFIGALCWSLNAPMVKYLTMDPLLLAALRSVIAGITLLPFLFRRKIVWNKWTIIYFFAYSSLCLSIIMALKSTSAAIAIGMQYSAVFWLFLLDLFILRKINYRSLLPVALILTGVALYMTSATSAGAFQGNLIAMSEGILFALMGLALQKSRNENVLGLLSLANLLTFALVFFLFPSSFSSISAIPSNSWIILLGLGVIQMTGGYGFFNMGLALISPQRASLIALWELIFSVIWVALFLHDYPSSRILLGLIFILLGIMADAILSTIALEKITNKESLP